METSDVHVDPLYVMWNPSAVFRPGAAAGVGRPWRPVLHASHGAGHPAACRFGNWWLLAQRLETHHQCQVHQRLPSQRGGRRVAGDFSECVRIQEVHRRPWIIEFVRFWGVLEVPSKLRSKALTELEVFLRRTLQPNWGKAGHVVPPRVADPKITLRATK